MELTAHIEQFYATADRAFICSPNPHLRFASVNYGESLETLRTGLGGEYGLALLVGGPGVGKTTLSEELGGWWRRCRGLVGKVTNTQVGAADFQRLVAYGFGINAGGTGSAVQIKLEKLLQQQAARRRPPLLIVDEAQNLNAEALEALRLLSNLRSADYRPLLRILLVAEDGFLERLREKSQESLRQRLHVVVQLHPLDIHATRDYIAHHLSKADWRGQPTLSGSALQAIYLFSQGVPRWVNALMRYLLHLGAVERIADLDTPDVERAVAELAQQRLHPKHAPRPDGPYPRSGDQPIDALANPRTPAASSLKPFKPELAWPHRIRKWLSKLDAFGALEYQYRRTIRTLVHARAAWGRSAHRNWAVGLGVVAVSALSVGVLSDRWPESTTALAKSPATPPAIAGMLHAPSMNAAILPSQAAAVVMHVDPAILAKGVMGYAENIRSLVATAGEVAVSASERRRASQGVSDLLSVADFDFPNPPQVDALHSATHPLPELAHEFRSGKDLKSGAMIELDSEIETALNGLDIADQGAAERFAGRLSALPSTHSGVVASRAEDELWIPDSGDDRRAEHALPLASEPGVLVAPTQRQLATAQSIAVAILHAEPAVAPVERAVVEPPRSSELEQLLRAAAAAIAESRLTLPPENNAYEYFMAVLSEEPHNRRARAGLAKIVARYRELAQGKLEDGKLREAQRLVKRGLKVVADDSDLLALQADIDNRRKPVAPKPAIVLAAEPEPIADSLGGPVEEQDPTAHFDFEL